jgi:uncharacterized membrane protein
MSTPATIAKHPLHPMLVVFPIGLWVFSLASDFIFLLGGGAVWNDVAFYTMAGGLIGSLLAAVPGFFDMFSISDPKVGKMAWNHMILNLIATAVFALNLYLRMGGTAGAPLPIFLSGVGILLIAVSGWLGGEMVYVHGMGVQQSGIKGGTKRTARSESPINLRNQSR